MTDRPYHLIRKAVLVAVLGFGVAVASWLAVFDAIQKQIPGASQW